MLGVGNLKRRPVRTFLTFMTLVILTFTIMNFTTVKSVREKGWARFSDTATYSGRLLKYFNWQNVPLEALSVLRNAYAGKGVVAPRAWYDTGMTSDKSRAPLIPVWFGEKESPGRGMVGLSYLEPQVSGLDRILVKGRWFREGERFVALLPQRMADTLGVDPVDPTRNTVTVWGLNISVVGVFNDNGLRDNPDLDGEPVTPIVFPNQPPHRCPKSRPRPLRTARTSWPLKAGISIFRAMKRSLCLPNPCLIWKRAGSRGSRSSRMKELRK